MYYRKGGMKFKTVIFYRNEEKSLEIVEAWCCTQQNILSDYKSLPGSLQSFEDNQQFG